MLTFDSAGYITLSVTGYKRVSADKITADEKSLKTLSGDVTAVMGAADVRRFRSASEMISQNSNNTGTAERPLLKPDSRKNATHCGICLACLPETHAACQNQLKTEADDSGAVLLAGNTERR